MNYQLEHNKSEFFIQISPMKVNGSKYIIANQLTYYNEKYYISDNRELLKQKAVELKQQWIDEYTDKLQKSIDMKIKNKYK